LVQHPQHTTGVVFLLAGLNDTFLYLLPAVLRS
jgi:hypothetical protein